MNTFERVKFERRPQKEACMSLFMRAEWAGQWRKGGRKFTPFHTQIHPLREATRKYRAKNTVLVFWAKKFTPFMNSPTQRGNKKIQGKKTNSPPFIPKQISVLNEVLNSNTGKVSGFSKKVFQEGQVCDLSDKLVRREEFRKKSSVLNLNTALAK